MSKFLQLDEALVPKLTAALIRAVRDGSLIVDPPKGVELELEAEYEQDIYHALV